MNIEIFWTVVIAIVLTSVNITMWYDWKKWKRWFEYYEKNMPAEWERNRDTRRIAYIRGVTEAELKFKRQFERAKRDHVKGKDTWKLRMEAASASIADLIDLISEGKN